MSHEAFSRASIIYDKEFLRGPIITSNKCFRVPSHLSQSIRWAPIIIILKPSLMAPNPPTPACQGVQGCGIINHELVDSYKVSPPPQNPPWGAAPHGPFAPLVFLVDLPGAAKTVSKSLQERLRALKVSPRALKMPPRPPKKLPGPEKAKRLSNQSNTLTNLRNTTIQQKAANSPPETFKVQMPPRALRPPRGGRQTPPQSSPTASKEVSKS